MHFPKARKVSTCNLESILVKMARVLLKRTDNLEEMDASRNSS